MAAAASGETSRHIFFEMPLKLVFAYEHAYLVMNGHVCKLPAFQESLEDLMKGL